MDTDLPAPTADALSCAQTREHDRCFACGAADGDHGIGLRFRIGDDRADVAAEWVPPAWAVGYTDVVHGGLIATALDSAVIHSLFARGLAARTAELNVRYRHPVLPAARCEISARLLDRRGPVFRLQAELRQDGRLCARAVARCMTLSTQHP